MGGRRIRIATALLLATSLLALLVAPADRAVAQGRVFSLGAPAELVDSGLMKFLLPRFSLKTATRVELVGAQDPAVARLSREPPGRRVFTGPQGDWFLRIGDGEAAEAARRFESWLAGEIGQNTVAAFTVDGRQPYRPAAGPETQDAPIAIVGDAVEGERLAERHCGRCHMVNDRTRLTTIGSSPSFALVRVFPDWMRRFQSFYALRPHPAFTIVADVTEPFDPTRPPPIVPVRVTVDDIQAILAFAATIEPADLGRPLELR